jgi:plastocyanin
MLPRPIGMRKSLIAGTVITVSLMIGIAGCGGSGTTASPYGAGQNTPAAVKAVSSNTLTISGFKFSSISVAPGSTVTVQNKDSAGHTVNVNGTKIDLTVGGGETGTFVAPAKAGTFTLTCDFHPSMQGSLVVK